MAQAEDQQLLHAKRKAISGLFPYVLWQDRVGQQDMLDALSRVVMTSHPEQSVWHHVERYIDTLSNKPNPISLDYVITLASPHISWDNGMHNENMVARWAAAASAVPYTEEVGQFVVDTLLQIASVDSLRPHIPSDIWGWLNKRPSLPPVCRGRSPGTREGVVCQVRELGDIAIIKSYLLLVWSEWEGLPSDRGFAEMCALVREDFSGIGMGRHREDLIERLDHVLGQLNRGLEYLQRHRPSLRERNIQRAKEKHGGLKRVLLEVDREAMDVLARTPSNLIRFTRSTDVHGHTQNPIRLSCALCLSNACRLFRTLGFYNGFYPVVAFPPLSTSAPKVPKNFDVRMLPGSSRCTSRETCCGIVDICAFYSVSHFRIHQPCRTRTFVLRLHFRYLYLSG